MAESLKQTLKRISRRLSINGIDLNLYADLGLESRITLANHICRRSVDEGDFRQWLLAMRMVSRIGTGIPAAYRRKLWIIIADRSNRRRQVNWDEVYKRCFADEVVGEKLIKLEEQIDKDLHRTGSDLFSDEKKGNQQILKQVLMAYARWNPAVGYCQGMNMLAAIILEVVRGDKFEAFDLLIYLIDELLPPKYYSENMTGVTVDMAVLKELLRYKMPALGRHFDSLVGEDEPPLINAFTIQWLVTLFANSLPKYQVLRVWDLIFLFGNEIMLRMILAIWHHYSCQLYPLKTANEYFTVMHVINRELATFGLPDLNGIINNACNMEMFPFPYLEFFRNRFSDHINPYMHALEYFKANMSSAFNRSKAAIANGLADQAAGSSSAAPAPAPAAAGNEPEMKDLFDDQFFLISWASTAGASIFRRGPSPPGEGRGPDANGRIALESMESSSVASDTGIFGRRDSAGAAIMRSIVKQIEKGIDNLAAGPSNGQSNGFSFLSGAGGGSGGPPNLDITNLKKQYEKLKERHRQVHTIIKDGLQLNKPNKASEPGPSGLAAGGSSNKKESFSFSKLFSTNKKPSFLSNGSSKAFLSKLSLTLNGKQETVVGKVSPSPSKLVNGVKKTLVNRASTIPSWVPEEDENEAEADKNAEHGKSNGEAGGSGQRPPALSRPSSVLDKVQSFRVSGNPKSAMSKLARSPKIRTGSSSSGHSTHSKKHWSRSSAGSSTSTELCDELEGIKASESISEDYNSENEADNFSDLEEDVSLRFRGLSRTYSRSHENLRSASYEDEVLDGLDGRGRASASAIGEKPKKDKKRNKNIVRKFLSESSNEAAGAAAASLLFAPYNFEPRKRLNGKTKAQTLVDEVFDDLLPREVEALKQLSNAIYDEDEVFFANNHVEELCNGTLFKLDKATSTRDDNGKVDKVAGIKAKDFIALSYQTANFFLGRKVLKAVGDDIETAEKETSTDEEELLAMEAIVAGHQGNDDGAHNQANGHRVVVHLDSDDESSFFEFIKFFCTKLKEFQIVETRK